MLHKPIMIKQAWTAKNIQFVYVLIICCLHTDY